MNVLERAECLLDAGSSGNMNFTVIAEYRGCLEADAIQGALASLQQQHLLLRSTLVWDGDHCHFAETPAAIEIQVLPWLDDPNGSPAPGAWKPAAMAALRQRFGGGGEPLWRVSWLAGRERGQLLLTFHHAIADGLSAMALVQQLFALLAAAGGVGSPGPAVDWDAHTPELGQTFASAGQGAGAVDSLTERRDTGLSTSYVFEELSAEASAGVLAWTRLRGLRLNATLHAAFLQALVADGFLPAKTTATTVVNLRSLAEPPLPWELMRLLRVCVDTSVEVDPDSSLDQLASELHGVLQQQLSSGSPLRALNTIAAALEDGPTPHQLWQRSWRQGGLITNLGRVPVQAQHGELELARLFFVANVEPIALPHQPLAVLGALSFRDQLSLTLFHIEQQLGDARATAVLADTKKRLVALG
ncbi:hypothetical protein KBY75_13125 [Cyanobium sp. T1G-Tous]|uniref:phthiocerol/phthiodiolone dimycocerosyl transferase family protein n=1 Tax=Cyanobium sp. T1G-Tous TaxID=2823722 RepID=UPI0020CCDA97|nr:condensation domain-containing protein [Cyanobium sp. T1G-Tous]MCP9804508.1 hypothetical protein [Cyanobium sp. T1G-Tous]